MAKESGITVAINVDDSGGPTPRDLSNDISSWDLGTPRGVQDVTGQDQSAVERLLLLADYSVTLNGIFDDGTNLAHDVFSTIPSTSVPRTVSIAVSGQTLAVEAWLTDYQLSRAATGELTWTVPGVLQDGSVPTWS